MIDDVYIYNRYPGKQCNEMCEGNEFQHFKSNCSNHSGREMLKGILITFRNLINKAKSGIIFYINSTIFHKHS